MEAAELVGGKQEWPPLLEASIRDGTSSFTGEVELTHLQEYFKKTAVPPEQVELMVKLRSRQSKTSYWPHTQIVMRT